MEVMIFCFGIGMIFGGIIMVPLMLYFENRKYKEDSFSCLPISKEEAAEQLKKELDEEILRYLNGGGE